MVERVEKVRSLVAEVCRNLMRPGAHVFDGTVERLSAAVEEMKLVVPAGASAEMRASLADLQREIRVAVKLADGAVRIRAVPPPPSEVDSGLTYNATGNGNNSAAAGAQSVAVVG